jgi:hypothetical protein
LTTSLPGDTLTNLPSDRVLAVPGRSVMFGSGYGQVEGVLFNSRSSNTGGGDDLSAS